MRRKQKRIENGRKKLTKTAVKSPSSARKRRKRYGSWSSRIKKMNICIICVGNMVMETSLSAKKT